MPRDSRETSRQRHRSPSHNRERRERRKKKARYPRGETSTSSESTQPLSAETLAQLERINQRNARRSRVEVESSPSPKKERQRRTREIVTEEETFIDKRERRRSGERSDRKDRERRERREQEREQSRRRERREAEREESRRRERGEREREESRRRERKEAEREENRRRERERRREQEREEARRKERQRVFELEETERKENEILQLEQERKEEERKRRREERRKRRQVSGALLEEGEVTEAHGLRGGDYYDEKEYYREDSYKEKIKRPWSKKKKIYVAIGAFILLLLIVIPIAVVESKKSSSNSSSSGSSSGGDKSALDGKSESDLPAAAQGTYLDPWTWYETTDFNVTYTNETYGDLPIMGLNTSWDDSTSANEYTVALNKDWGSYATTPARGVNLGGWLSLEPFITPSLFDYDEDLGIIDEYTLCSYLGSKTSETLEEHYATFVTEQTFKDIADAGMDHVRIPYSYWAVVTYDDDPYLFRTSWRYLLRGIEWARKYGLRVNLDLHGLPGSQNGWNHSGRQGPISWLNGTDGDLNAQRSLDVHDRLSKFFAQDRYKNIIAFYGLANEPRMVFLNTTAVLSWTASAYEIVRNNSIDAYIVFGDGFMGLDNWQGKLQGYDGLLLDVHQYEIFNVAQIVYNHTQKVNYACDDWTEQAEQSMNTSTGFGPTIFAEWSQADTDCAKWLNDVNVGNRWTGTYNTGDSDTQVLSPTCPVSDSTTESCECDDANADSSDYSSDYKKFLLTFAEAQMTSFEAGWGWFYWTWKTESAIQWSYEKGLAAGILPEKAYDRSWNCSQAVPSFSGLSETY